MRARCSGGMCSRSWPQKLGPSKVSCGFCQGSRQPACLAAGAPLVGSGPDGGGVLDGLRVLRFRGGDGAAGAHGPEFNERSGGLLNRTQYPSDVIALVVLWRLRYRLTLRDLAEMFLQRGIVFSHEAVREWEAKLAPVLAGKLRRRRRGKGGAGRRSWFVDETLYLVGVSGRS